MTGLGPFSPCQVTTNHPFTMNPLGAKDIKFFNHLNNFLKVKNCSRLYSSILCTNVGDMAIFLQQTV